MEQVAQLPGHFQIQHLTELGGYVCILIPEIRMSVAHNLYSLINLFTFDSSSFSFAILFLHYGSRLHDPPL